MPTVSHDARPLHVVERAQLAQWRQAQSPAVDAWLDAQQYDAAPQARCCCCRGQNGIAGALVAIADPLDPVFIRARALRIADRRLGIGLAAGAGRARRAAAGLGPGRVPLHPLPHAHRAPARLLLSDPDAESLDVLEACVRVRDLVNTPTEHMGPDELEAAARAVARAHGAESKSWRAMNCWHAISRAIHAVGPRLAPRAAADRAALGRCRRAARGAGRQGRVLRHRRPGHQARRRHAPHEEGHGRRRARPGAGRAGDGAPAAGAADAADPRVENAIGPNALRPARSSARARA
jgi:hypothetical protein